MSRNITIGNLGVGTIDLDELITNAFKKVKFTRGKKQERIEQIKRIKRAHDSNRNKLDYWRDNERCIKVDFVFAHIEAIFNDRSLYKRLDTWEQVIILFMLYCCDFGDSVQVTDEDFRWLKEVKYHLVEVAPFGVAHSILLCCPTIRDIFS